jgi:hypothetical protein
MAYYEESGKINTGLTVVAMIFAAGLIGLLGYGYSFVTDLNPFIYFNFIGTIGYVFVIVFIIGIVQRIGKIRSYSTGVIVTIILALFGLYAVWTTYIMVVFEKDLNFAFTNFFDSIEILSNRSYSIGRRSSSIDLSGGILMTCWVIESVILALGPIVIVAAAGKNDSVYCEDCEKWADDEKIFLKKSPLRLTKANIEEKILNRKLNELLELETTDGNEGIVGEHYEIKFTSCGSCKKAFYLSVNFVSLTMNSKSEIEKNEELILPFYKLERRDIPRDILNPSRTMDSL